MPGRMNVPETPNRYGFQGQESDDEITSSRSHYSYEYRVQDARTGRFFSVDPLYAKYAQNSTYAFSENRVIDSIELEGLEACIGCPNTGANEGDVYIQESAMYKHNGGVTGVTSEMLNYTDADGNTLNQVVWMADNSGGWHLAGIEMSNGTQYFYSAEAQEYQDSEGNAFDNPWSMDVMNMGVKFVEPAVNFMVAVESGKNPFANLQIAFARCGCGMGEFISNSIYDGLTGLYEDISYGGARRRNALSGLWLGGLSNGPSLGLGSNFVYNGAFRNIPKSALNLPRLGNSAGGLNYYTALAYRLGVSPELDGLKTRAGIFVQANHALYKMSHLQRPSILYSNSPATRMGRMWQNQAIGTGLGIIGFDLITWKFYLISDGQNN